MKAVTPKKKLGQHFLNDLNIAKKITDQPFINHGKNVLEIDNQENYIDHLVNQYRDMLRENFADPAV